MGWIFAIAFLVVAIVKGTADISAGTFLIAAAIFALAGSIAFASHADVRLTNVSAKENKDKEV